MEAMKARPIGDVVASLFDGSGLPERFFLFSPLEELPGAVAGAVFEMKRETSGGFHVDAWESPGLDYVLLPHLVVKLFKEKKVFACTRKFSFARSSLRPLLRPSGAC